MTDLEKRLRELHVANCVDADMGRCTDPCSMHDALRAAAAIGAALAYEDAARICEDNAVAGNGHYFARWIRAAGTTEGGKP